jgi:hypothetical protein
MAGCSLEASRRFVADTELEGGCTERRSLEKGDREGHDQKTGQSAVEEDEGKKEKIIMLMKKKKIKKKEKEEEEEEEEEEAMNTNLAKKTPFSIPFPVV